MLGSVTPDDLIGDPLAPVFNYRVFIRDDALTAEYFIDNKCYDLTDKSKIRQSTFAVSAEGIDEAAAWLEAEYHKYERNI